MPTKSRTRLFAFCSLLLAAALFLSAPAYAQRCEAPPGLSGLEQYCETIPGAGGDQGAGGGGGVRRGHVPASVRRQLERKGPEGRKLLAYLESSGTPSRGSAKGAGVGAAGKPQSPDKGDESNGNVVSAVKSAVEDGPTVGGALPWILLGLTLFALGAAWLRMRGRGAPDA